MNLQTFVGWSWGAIMAASVAGGTTVAVLRAPSAPPAPEPVMHPTAAAFSIPAVAPDALAAPLLPRLGTPWKPRPSVGRIAHAEGRHWAEPDRPARVTVVPPIPPTRLAENAPLRAEPRVSRAALPRAAAAPKVFERTARGFARPAPAEPAPSVRYYAYYSRHPRYTYYSYSYYPYTYYPYPYSYSYSY